MAEIRQKPKMDAPKTKSPAAQLPKEAGRMLLEEYREAAREKCERAGRPEQEATEKVERGAQGLGRQGMALARKKATGFHPFSKHPRSQQTAHPQKTGPFSVSPGGLWGNSLQYGAFSPLRRQAVARREEARVRAENIPTIQTSPAVKDNGNPPVGSAQASHFSAGSKERSGHVFLSSRPAPRPEQLSRHAGGDGLHSSPPNGPKSVRASAGVLKIKGQNNTAYKGKQQVVGATMKTKQLSMEKAKKAAKSAKRAKLRTKTAATTIQKTASATVKLARRVAVAIAKATTALVQAVLALAGPAGVVVMLLLMVAAIAIFLASPFGVFYAGEDEAAKTQMQSTIGELATEYHTKIRTIIEENPHDEMRFNYTNRGYLRQDNLVDILAVYALQTANLQGGDEVISLHPQVLAEVFWAMQELQFEISNEPVYEERQVYNEETEEYETVGEWKDHHVLLIEATCKGAGEMADSFAFGPDQQDILDEMLSGPYDSYFENMIGSASLFLAIGDGGSVVGSGNFIWPSPASTYVSSPYGHRPGVGIGDFHLGIDIAAGAGTPVLAADGGTVISNSVHYSYGTHLLIDHGNGTQTLYAHMSAAHVGVGDSITQGQTIGLVGNTGVSFGAHLHFEVKVGGSTVNPLQFFSNYTVG